MTEQDMRDDIVRFNNAAPPGYLWIANAPPVDNDGPNDTESVHATISKALRVPADDVIVLRNAISKVKDGNKMWAYSAFVKDKWSERVENVHTDVIESTIEREKELKEITDKLMGKLDDMLAKIKWTEANDKQADSRFIRDMDDKKLN